MGKLNTYLQLIEAERKANKLHINKLAGQIGITPQYYGKIIRGESVPAASILFELLEAVGLEFIVFKGTFYS